jgi:hypothetical protein
MSDTNKKLKNIRDLINLAQNSIHSAKKILSTMVEDGEKDTLEFDTDWLESYDAGGSKIIEWVFTGEGMLGSDGNIYPVPQNYASKSLLVQGSKLKATIDGSGKILYKIIKEIEYESKKWIITQEGEKYHINTGDANYNVLLAAITFHKCQVGDSVSIRVPHGKEATYAVIESILPKS